MLIVLSPAKSLDFETLATTELATIPDHLDRSSALINVLRGYTPGQLAQLMALSDPLAALNVARYASWSSAPPGARQAIMAFNGDVYAGFEARTLKPKALAFAQQHVRILSGLYGVLRPFDLIHPHRLEMGSRLATPGAANLYEFWGERVTTTLNGAIADNSANVLLNLASEEYFKSVMPKLLTVPVISPVFQDWKNGQYKIISFFAKRARGMMARYAAEKGIIDAEKLKKFNASGYAYSEDNSSATRWVFRRKSEA